MIKQISLIAMVAIGIGLLLIPGTNVGANALGQLRSMHVYQSISQSNTCSDSICANIASNNVHIGVNQPQSQPAAALGMHHEVLEQNIGGGSGGQR
ncbi:MAG: hypothetical protein WA667_07935 [Candidatus Nitrosopolaris sp.]